MIYRIAEQEEWAEARKSGWLRPPDLAKEGFIHCCAEDQVPRVAAESCRGRSNLLLLEIEESLLGSEVRWEPPPGGSEFFPHVYGPIPVQAVTQAMEFKPPRNLQA